MNSEIFRARTFIKDHIFGRSLPLLTPAEPDITRIKLERHSAYLEETLFGKSFTEDYRNLETLKSRVIALIRLTPEQYRSLQQRANSAAARQTGSQVRANQRQNGPSVASNTFRMSPELLHTRAFVREHIFRKAVPYLPQPVNGADITRFKDKVKEDYTNIRTLGSRFEALNKRGLIIKRQVSLVNFTGENNQRDA